MDYNQRSRGQKSGAGHPARAPRRSVSSRMGLEKRGAPAQQPPRGNAPRPRGRGPAQPQNPQAAPQQPPRQNGGRPLTPPPPRPPREPAKPRQPQRISRGPRHMPEEEPGLELITRRPPKQKFSNFEEYLNAHGGMTVPLPPDPNEPKEAAPAAPAGESAE